MVRSFVRHSFRSPAWRMLLLLAVMLIPASRAAAQEEYQNLQVLPKDISRARLTAIMRGFTGALGARCSSCHVGEEGLPLATYDFAADDKPMKVKARAMLKMVQAINGEYLANLPQRDDPELNVTCATCHRGVHHPEPIEYVVEKTAKSDGMDAALQKYRDLREKYYGAASYDFTDRPLVGPAQSMAGSDAEGATRILEMNLEFNPQSAASMFALAGIAEKAGDNAKAIEMYKKGLEIQPDNQRAQDRLKALGG